MRTSIDIPIHLVPYAHRTEVSGDEVFYYAAGRQTAPVLLLLHGLGDDADTWRHLILPLSRFFRVIAPDLAGFGRSRSHDSAASITSYARRMHRFLQALSVERCALVGHSFGAMVAQRMSMIAGVTITRQVLIGGVLPVQAQLPASVPVALLLPAVGGLVLRLLRRSPHAALRSLLPFFAAFDQLPSDDQRFLQRRVWARVSNAALTRQLVRSLRWLAVDSLLRSNEFRLSVVAGRIPTQLIVGERDRLVEQQQLAQTVALRPDYQLHILPECGHTPQVEQPETVSSLIVEHLAPRPMTLLRRRGEDGPAAH